MEDELKEIEETEDLEKPSEIEEEGFTDEESVTDEPNEASVEAETTTESEEVAPNEMSTQEETTTEESFIPGVSTDDGFENHYTTPMDFSWLDEKAKDVSTMTAEAGISTELNNPLEHEKTKQEALQKDVEKTAEEEAAKKAQIFNEKQLKQIEDFDPNSGVWLTQLGNVLSFGIAPKVNEVPNFDKEAYKSFIESKAKESGNADKAIRDVNSLIEKSQLGLAKEGIEYWKATGDTLGNKYAVKAEQTVVDALVAYENGQITEEQMNNIVETVTNPSNTDQLKSLFSSPALTGLEAMAAGAAVGAAASKIIEKGAPVIFNKLIQSNSKLGQKIVEKIASNKAVQNRYKYNVLKDAFESGHYAEQAAADVSDWGRKLAQAIVDGDKAATQRLMDSRKLADNLDVIFGKEPAKMSQLEDIMYDLVNRGMADAAKDFAKDVLGEGTHIIQEDLDLLIEVLKNPSEYADWFVAMSQSLGYVNPADMAKAITAAVTENKSLKKGMAATGITAATIDKAQAAPTGIFDKSGKMIDTKEIVKERQENPYTGEDKITLQSREGSVTVDPREAVIIGEAESLTPTQGYTEEVKELAQEEKREVYEKEPVEMVQPTQHDLSIFDKAVDYVQAILGGRDLNNDKTITNQEWYQSTIGPVVESMKETFSLPDLKSVAKDVGNKVERFVDRVGGNLAASIPGVINLSTGEIQVVDREVPATEDMAKLLQTKVVDSLPSWGDDVQSDAMKSVVANTVMENLAPMYGNVGVITLVKAAGTYATETIAEICHLNDYELSNDQKGMINFAITNAIGLSFEPVSTIIRDVTSGYGLIQRGKIEATLSGETPAKSDTVYIVPYDGGNDIDSQYGIGKERVDADTQYSGYREQAKESNVATDYNRGLDKTVNAAVSDKYAKNFMIMLQKEPSYIRKVLIDIPKRRAF